MRSPHPNPLEQEPLPQLRDAGEPLLDTATVANSLGVSSQFVRDAAENRRLFGFKRNAQASKGADEKGTWKFTARALKLYEARTANFCGLDVAHLLLDLARRLSPALRLWLRNELTRVIERGE